MEIGQFLRSRPRLTALALLFPVLAAVAAFLVLSAQPPRYSATATVSVPGSSADSASRVGIFVANFDELASSEAVTSAVAGATGESRGDLVDGLEVSRIGQSSLFTVVYTSTDREVTEPVVRTEVEETFARQLPVARTDAALDAANDAYQAALAERRAYEDEIGTLQPDRVYSDVSSRIRSLRSENPVTSTPQQNVARQGEIAALTNQRETLVPQIRRMQELDQAVSSAAGQVDDAEGSAASARRDAQEAQSPSTILSVDVVDATSTASLLQGVGVAAVAGLLVGIAVLVLPDVVGRRRTPGDTGAGAPPAPAGPVDGTTTDAVAAGPPAAPVRSAAAPEGADDLEGVGHGR